MMRFFLPGGRFCRFALVILVLGAAVGCKSWGTVSGKITYKNKPIPGGSIQFLGSDGAVYSAEVNKEDGSYSVRVPSGDAQVLISCIDDEVMVKYVKERSAAGKGTTDFSKPPPNLPKEPPSGTFSLIPEKYGDFQSSGLKVTVKAGPNTQDFPLKD